MFPFQRICTFLTSCVNLTLHSGFKRKYIVSQTKTPHLKNIWSFFKVLLLSLIVVAVLSVGLKDIKLTTDPVELWSAPNSRARQEKEFHDTYFDPFYRTNQVILTAPGRKSHIYDSLLFGPQNFSGIMSKELIIELLELQTRIQVLKVKADCWQCLKRCIIPCWLTETPLILFLEYSVLVRWSEPDSKFEGCVLCAAKSQQPFLDWLCSQQLATVLPEQPRPH